MKILIASLLKRKITPEITASRPRVIFDLATGLVKKGHQVSILGPANSKVPGAKIISALSKGWVEYLPAENQFYYETGTLVQMAKMIERLAPKFDVIHNHTYPEFINLLVAKNIKRPFVTTVHAQMTPDLDKTLAAFNEIKNSYLISISQAHCSLAKKAKIYKVIHNGVDTGLYKFHPKKEDYLLWIGRLGKAKDKAGRFMDAKGVRWAIKLAEKTNSRLILVANVEDIKFFERDVKPHLSDKIKWVGPISSEQPLSKQEIVTLMQKAKAFLMTINWREPFGLVMAEAMSCGTPVIGFDRGSVSELVVNGQTGFVVKPEKGIEGLKEALKNIKQINPQDCRDHAEKNFSLESMVNNYEKLYQDILERKNA